MNPNVPRRTRAPNRRAFRYKRTFVQVGVEAGNYGPRSSYRAVVATPARLVTPQAKTKSFIPKSA